jgi:hypothetical protein
VKRPEQEIQKSLFAHVAARGERDAFIFAVPNGGFRRRVEAAILKGCGVVRGVPDIVAVRGGHLYGLELKAPGGRLSPAQRDAHAALAAAGATVAVAVGLDQALDVMEGWGLLKGSCQ